ncbi:hypothetical protein EDB80DRAFT_77425 [Ilyonectria destructans]|nr:hypothetical protein EDB80DRAFT_77425 [Ilyonectria destructans]
MHRSYVFGVFQWPTASAPKVSRRLSNLSVGQINNMSPMHGCQSRIFFVSRPLSMHVSRLAATVPRLAANELQPRASVLRQSDNALRVPHRPRPPKRTPESASSQSEALARVNLRPRAAGRPAICPDGRWCAGGWWDERARLARGSRSHSLLELELLPFLRGWVVAGEKIDGEVEVSVGAERQGGRQRGTKGPGQTAILAVAA